MIELVFFLVVTLTQGGLILILNASGYPIQPAFLIFIVFAGITLFKSHHTIKSFSFRKQQVKSIPITIKRT